MRQLFFIGGKFKRKMSVLKKLGEKIKAEIRERAGESNSMEQMSREELIEGCRKQLRESFDPKENMIVTDYKHWVGIPYQTHRYYPCGKVHCRVCLRRAFAFRKRRI